MDDYGKFLADGGNIKKAKLFNNAMSPHFFDIDIEQVHKIKHTN